MAMTRNTNGEDTTTRLTGLLGLPDGFESFADEDLVAAVGSVPFAEQIATSGATPESSISASRPRRTPRPDRRRRDERHRARRRPTRVDVPTDGTILDGARVVGAVAG